MVRSFAHSFTRSLIYFAKGKMTLITHFLHFWLLLAEMGYFRIKAGANVLGIEESIAWATPGQFTTHNWPCSEDGTDCGPSTQYYVEPSSNMEMIQRRLRLYSNKEAE